MQSDTVLFCLGGQFLAEPPVRQHTTATGNTSRPGRIDGVESLGHQNINDRLLHSCGNIRERRHRIRRLRLLQIGNDRGLQSGEREVVRAVSAKLWGTGRLWGHRPPQHGRWLDLLGNPNP